ncbi:MAG: large ribosomal subunit protein uL22 [Planctomycetota bacterium]|jgi:large subunit ribosomal protein L22
MAEEVAEKPKVKPRFRAKLRYARIAPRKLRYVADLIRGKDYNAAVSILRASPQRGATFCRKVLESAMSNATMIISSPDNVRKKREEYPPEALREIDVDNLHVVEIRVDQGLTMKRWRPSSMRRPTQIRKRFSHLEIVLQERERKASKKERSRRRRRAKKEKEQKTAEAAVEKAKEGAPQKEAPKKPPKKKAKAKAKKKEAKGKKPKKDKKEKKD